MHRNKGTILSAARNAVLLGSVLSAALPQCSFPGNSTEDAQLLVTAVFLLARSHTRYVFTANATSQDISIFSFNDADGSLNLAGSASVAPNQPRVLAVAPSSRMACSVGDAGSPEIQCFSLNYFTGQLTPTYSMTSGIGPFLASFDPQFRALHVVNNIGTVMLTAFIDPSSATFTSTTNVTTTTGLREQAYNGSSYSYIASTTNLIGSFSVGTTGALSFITTTTGLNTPVSLAMHPSLQVLYSADNSSTGVRVMPISNGVPAAGAVTSAGIINPVSVRVHPGGNFLYLAHNTAGQNISLFRIQANGSLTQIGTASASGTGPLSMAIDATGSYLLVTGTYGSVDVFRIDQNGYLTLAGTAAAGGSPRGITLANYRDLP
jgi:6-phosphogluconolactonase (cycloisomerase 2 family)